MHASQLRFVFLNAGHFLDHYLMLVFASVAALRLMAEWDMAYHQLIPYATPGLVAFGVCAIPAGWLADKWSRTGMMVIFFIGIGGSAVYTSFTNTPLEMAIGLILTGAFAAIYHPVGLALVVEGRQKLGVPLAINGVFGNLGVACAALITGLLIDSLGWRSAFYIPGAISMLIGVLYWYFESNHKPIIVGEEVIEKDGAKETAVNSPTLPANILRRIVVIILIVTLYGGLIFQSTTFALPKVFEERLQGIAGTASSVGFYTFLVFGIAAFAQLVVGYLLDKYTARTILLWVAMLQAVLFVSMINLSGLPSLIVAIAFMLVVFGEIPITDVLVAQITGSEWRSRAYALTYLAGFSVSAAAAPMIAGIHYGWGFDVLFALLAVFAVLIFIAALFLPSNIQYLKKQSV